ncbi:retrovirus-related pol polyprotein from transposon TNT 1-94 [Tanacetum coccineum]
MNSWHLVYRRPLIRDSQKNSVLANSMNLAKKVGVYVRKNKQTDNTSATVASNKENVIDVDVANASKAKTLLCVSCMQNVLIPCHDKCLANYKLNVHSNVCRALSTSYRTPKSLDTTVVVLKTRFSEKLAQSKSLDTTSIVSKSKIDVGSASKAKHKVSSASKPKKQNLKYNFSNIYMKNKIRTSRIRQKWFESQPNVVWSPVNTTPNDHISRSYEKPTGSVKKWVVKLPTCPCVGSSCVAGTVRFRNDNFAAIIGYGDYIQGNITICHVYYVEGDDLLTGGRESNLYTISIFDMAASSLVCLMSKATSTKSWLWHRRLLHLNFGTINDLTRLDLVDGLPKFKYGKDHLCSACERGNSKKDSHPPKLVPSDHSKLELFLMDLCGPMRVASINGKKYILVIVDDYSRYTWVYFLHSKDETPEIIKKFIAQAELNYKAKVCKIRTENVSVGLLRKEKLYAKFTKSEARYWPTPKMRRPSREGQRMLRERLVPTNGKEGKANVVTNALSRKERVKPRRVRAMAMTIQYGVRGMILEAQSEAFKQENVLAERLHGTVIMDEAHKSKYSVHPRADKMYHDLRDIYWWPGMKRDIATYWDKITMDFITKLPRSKNGHDTIWVIVDRLTKLALLAIREDYSTERLAKIYIDEIVARYGVPVSIISDKDGGFTSRCWRCTKALGNMRDLRTAFITTVMVKVSVRFRL